MQILIDILLNFATYSLIALSFSIPFYTTKFFNLAHASIISLGAYIVYFLHVEEEFPLVISISGSIIFCSFLGLALERFIYRPMRNRGIDSLMLLVASLGVYTVISNIITIKWGTKPKSFLPSSLEKGITISDGSITYYNSILVIISLLLVISIILFFNYSLLGRKIKAIFSNSHLCHIFGMDTNKAINYSWFFGSMLAATGGILISMENGMQPQIGFEVFLFSLVALIVGGVGSINWMLYGTLLVSCIQVLTPTILNTNIWNHLVLFGLLLGFLIWKPLGFSGEKLEKKI